MPKPTQEVVATQQHRRTFLQLGGPSPTNPVIYAGQDAQYMIMDGVTRPILGGIESLRVPDPTRLKQFKIVARKASPPDLPTATLRLLENHGILPWQLGEIKCPFNVYMPVGMCNDLSDFLAGWTDWVEIYSYAEATEVDMGSRSAWEDDNQTEDALSLTLENIYAVGALSFAEKAAIMIDKEVVDAVYGSDIECGVCGPADDGTKKVYAITKSSGAGSPGLPAELVYTLDGGLTWTQTNITGFGATEDPLAIDIVSGKLVILGDGAYFWATLNTLTGVPGTFTKVSAGFNAAHDPNDIYVLSAREVFFCGQDGYIYRSTDITVGVSEIDAGVATTKDLTRIHGDGGETVVACGDDSTVVKSVNRGQSWATTTASPGTLLALIALAVKNSYEFWVGCGTTGRIYFTLDGGENWTMKTFTGTGTGSVRDIVIATEEVIHFAHDDGSTGYLWTSWNGGKDFVRNDGASKRILNWPVLDYINRIAVPKAGPPTNANHLVVGGLAGNATDGILLVGEAAEK